MSQRTLETSKIAPLQSLPRVCVSNGPSLHLDQQLRRGTELKIFYQLLSAYRNILRNDFCSIADKSGFLLPKEPRKHHFDVGYYSG
jgi:hypothetical protein